MASNRVLIALVAIATPLIAVICGSRSVLGQASAPAPPRNVRVVTDATFNANDWTQFRRDAQRTAATKQELRGPLTLRWQKGFSEWPHVFAEPAIVQGRVYLANMDGVLTCLDAASGATLWTFATGAAITTTTAVVDGRVHVVNLKGRLVTLSTSGTPLWEYTVAGAVYASPAVQDGLVLFGTVSGLFYAFDAAAGGAGPRWVYDAGATIDVAPVVVGNSVIFAAENMKAVALRLSDGALLWSSSLPGARTWNGHPVASLATNKVYFSTVTEFVEQGSSHREVVEMYDFMNRTGPLSSLAAYVDQFIGQNRTHLQPAVVLDAATGQTVTRYTVAPDDTVINGLPFNSWYWGSIRPALWQGSKLLLQSMWRNIIVDLTTNRIYQPNASQTQTKHFVRGDEQVPLTIGGNRAYGGIGRNVAFLNLADGSRGNLLGVFGSEAEDSTPLNPPLASDHYLTFPGTGYVDRNGVFIVANGRGYFVQYGWIYCFDGTVVTVP